MGDDDEGFGILHPTSILLVGGTWLSNISSCATDAPFRACAPEVRCFINLS